MMMLRPSASWSPVPWEQDRKPILRPGTKKKKNQNVATPCCEKMSVRLLSLISLVLYEENERRKEKCLVLLVDVRDEEEKLDDGGGHS